MKRKEIKNKSDFLNIGSKYIIYSDYDCEDIDPISYSEEIVNRLLDDSFLIRWFSGYKYYTVRVVDHEQHLICYLTFYDDYVCIDLSYDSLVCDYHSLGYIYSLFTGYYYYYD